MKVRVLVANDAVQIKKNQLLHWLSSSNGLDEPHDMWYWIDSQLTTLCFYFSLTRLKRSIPKGIMTIHELYLCIISARYFQYSQSRYRDWISQAPHIFYHSNVQFHNDTDYILHTTTFNIPQMIFHFDFQFDRKRGEVKVREREALKLICSKADTKMPH